jgi:menaquinone-dependent protoporphyrinogen oxidase
MSPLPVLYATHDGHTRRIAERIAVGLTAAGVVAEPLNAAGVGSAQTLANLPYVILIAAIRYGYHLREAEGVLDAYGALKDKPPLALASVNLTARKPDKCTLQTNPYLRKWIKRHRLAPDLAIAIAGRLVYPRYNLFDRLAIQLIMTMTGGVTDPSAEIDYTDWNGVDAFAAKLAERVRMRMSANAL